MHIDNYEGSYIAAASLLVVGTAQWLTIGHFLQERFRYKPV
jgi:hypothetical protein